MKIHLTRVIAATLGVLILVSGNSATAAELFARYSVGNTTSYGLVEGDRVRQLSGDLFGTWKIPTLITEIRVRLL